MVKTPLAAENRAFSKTDVNDPQEKESADGERFTPQERQMQILKMMAENERITISAMVQELQVTKRTILRDIDKMKKQGWLKREGSEKNGRWILLWGSERTGKAGLTGLEDRKARSAFRRCACSKKQENAEDHHRSGAD